MKKIKIASYLVKEGFLSVDQAKTILEIQSKMTPLIKQRFGRIAVSEGFIKENILNKAILDKERKEFGY
ncbi:MAG: hypothetical protein JXJ04_01080 [Spirochaetales bacterium]|nr:hypothetical protein [Spirochaetales bacterium]